MAFPKETTGVQQDEPIAVEPGKVQIMQNHNGSQRSLLVQPFQQIHDLHLVAYVEMSCWFIEEQQLGFLCKGPSHRGELAFTTAEFSQWPIF